MASSKDFFDFKSDPILNFQELLKLAERKGVPDHTAMSLSTVSAQGKPSSRIVLLKDVEDGKFVFFTNYQSQKSQEIEANKNVELLFYWPQMYVQIHIAGIATKVDRAASEAYFKTRPRISQIGAWASQQSERIESYEVLERKFKKVEEQYKDQEIPCPPNWGGFQIDPQMIEFWFGMDGRLHYRYVYEKSGAGWLRSMKSP